jgi:hypothetical protein
MTPSASDIYRCLIDIVPTAAALPRVTLTGPQRKKLSGSTSRLASRLVRTVGRALADDPALFADLAVAREDMLARQDRALAYFSLYTALERLAGHARDCYLVEQAHATRDAMAVVCHGRSGRQGAYRPELRRRLGYVLCAAEALLQGEQRRKERLARRGQAP